LSITSSNLLESGEPQFFREILAPSPSIKQALDIQEIFEERRSIVPLSSVLGLGADYAGKTWGQAFLESEKNRDAAWQWLESNPAKLLSPSDKPEVLWVSPNNGKSHYAESGGAFVAVARPLFWKTGREALFGESPRVVWIRDSAVHEKIRNLLAQGLDVSLGSHVPDEVWETERGKRIRFVSHWWVDDNLLSREELLRFVRKPKKFWQFWRSQ